MKRNYSIIKYKFYKSFLKFADFYSQIRNPSQKLLTEISELELEVEARAQRPRKRTAPEGRTRERHSAPFSAFPETLPKCSDATSTDRNGFLS